MSSRRTDGRARLHIHPFTAAMRTVAMNCGSMSCGCARLAALAQDIAISSRQRVHRGQALDLLVARAWAELANRNPRRVLLQEAEHSARIVGPGDGLGPTARRYVSCWREMRSSASPRRDPLLSKWT
jgi:hypothetical protein